MRFNRYAKHFLEDFYSLIFPSNCVNCSRILNQNEKHLCTYCYLDLPYTNYHIYSENPLLKRFQHNPFIIHAFSMLKYQNHGVAQKLIHALKYEGKKEIGVFLGELYGNELVKSEFEIDFIVPVPIHRDKLKKRGYNQSEYFAQGLASSMNFHVEHDLLVKTQNTSTQTQKSKVNRIKSIADAYSIKLPTKVIGKSILLVDDVITTGSTINVIADLLVQNHVKSIYIGAIATGIK